MTNIILLDDHPVFSEGLAQLLMKEDWVKQVIQFVSSDAFFAAQQESNFINTSDMILLDVSLAELINGVDVCRKVKSEFPDNKVIGLSMHNEYRYISGMLDAGANGYLLKSDTFDDIIKGIKKVQEGEVYLSNAARETLHYYESNQVVLTDLSFREKRIIELSLKGHTNNKIAEILNISHKTVEYYKSGLYSKFGVKNVIELINLLNAH